MLGLICFAFGLGVAHLYERSRYSRLLRDADDNAREALRIQYNAEIYPLQLEKWEREDRYPGRRARPLRLPPPPVRYSE